MRNLLSLNPKIHRLDTDAEKCGGVSYCQWEVFVKEPCAYSRFLVWRQLLLPVNDNYFSLLATTTLFAKQRWNPTLVLTGAEDRHLSSSVKPLLRRVC